MLSSPAKMRPLAAFICAQAMGSNIGCGATPKGSHHLSPSDTGMPVCPPPCSEGDKQGKHHADCKWMLRLNMRQNDTALPVSLYKIECPFIIENYKRC